ncbi:hypothetical protein CFP65_6988 [Kitasatospora sp. MMS16-BH015]|uniref:recombinase family protein n=1 Tax=Kitasatospora sp. MMS16-BH015 TaxID=2018025 RepID=UPI000CA36A96|nr:recombinase family protein [Kitasatospora sp. MMS16-BH015]AUG81600.1 hypothetical protein CFP65_6988 [Kitasatospora sp. MMS16-BH015]
MTRLYGFADHTGQSLLEAEATALRKTTAVALTGLPSRPLVSWMNGEGYRTTRGGLWSVGTLCRLLANPTIAGLEFEAGVLVPNGRPGIITPDQYRLLQSRRRDRLQSERRHAVEAESLLGLGLLRCGISLAPLTASVEHGAEGASYGCPHERIRGGAACRPVRTPVDVADRALAECGRRHLAAPGGVEHVLLLQQGVLADWVAVRSRLSDLRQAAALPARALAAGGMTAEEYRRQTEVLNEQLRSELLLEAELVGPANCSRASVELMAVDWHASSVADRRAVLRLLFTHVDVLPSGDGAAGGDGSTRILAHGRAVDPFASARAGVRA